MTTELKTRRQATNNAEAFLNRFGTDSIYAFIGRSDGWASSGYSSSSSGSYPDVDETVENDFDTWRNMYALKKVTVADVSFVIPTNDWATSTTYDMYEHDVELATDASTLDYFVSEPNSSTLQIYKCINNGSMGDCTGAASTVSPVTASGINTSIPDNVSDNYRWKFMYSISNYTDSKFYNTTYIPVSRTGATASNQALVKAAATDGAIDHIKITSVGSGYTSVPSVTITGDGTGATAIALVKNISSSSSSAMGSSSSSGFECPDTSSSSSSSSPTSSSSSSSSDPCDEVDGSIIEIIMINRGTGYTYADVSLSGGGGSGATATAIIPPKWGHGYDPVNELAAKVIMVVVDFEGTETNAISAENDFRQFGLLVNPTTYGASTVATGSVYKQTTDLTLADAGTSFNGSTYTADEVITGDASGASGTVVEWNASSTSVGVLELANVTGTFVSGESLNADGDKTITLIDNPDLEFGSGEIIHTQNNTPVDRDLAQRDRLRMIFTF